MISAHQLAREIREPGSGTPSQSDPPAFLAAPTTIARKAVRIHHSQGSQEACRYIRSSVLGRWTGHTNPSMASNARNTIAGLDNYVAGDAADGRALLGLDEETVVVLAGGPVRVRFDVVLDDDGDRVAGRIVLWDGPDFTDDEAATIASVYAIALPRLHPDRVVTTIGIWQARRDHIVELPMRAAMAKRSDLEQIRRRLPR